MKTTASKGRYFEAAIIVVGVVWAIISFQFDYFLDYPFYMKQWSNIAQGGDPYLYASGKFTRNAYGPLHSLMTAFYVIHPNIPRVVFSCLWLAAVFFLFRSFHKRHLKSRHYLMLSVFLVLNPWVLKLFLYGHNDLIASALLVLSLLFMYHCREKISAWCLAAAVLYKFFPVILIPFMCIDNRKLVSITAGWFSLKTLINSIRWKFILHLFIPLFVLYGIHFLLYGDTFIIPFQFLVERESTATSFPQFLETHTGFAFVNNHSFLILFIGCILLFAVYLLAKWDVYIVCLLALIMMCLLSRVFYFPYLSGVLMILPFYLYLIAPAISTRRATSLLCIYFGMLAGIFVMILFLQKFTELPMDEISGIKGGVYALANTLLIIALLMHKFSNRSMAEKQNARVCP